MEYLQEHLKRIQINIDGSTSYFSEDNSSLLWQVIVFEVTDLPLKTHTVEIITLDTSGVLLDAIDMAVGDKCRLSIDDLANSTNVKWSSYDPTIATVPAKGKVTAISEGLTYIVASDKDGNELGRIYIRVRQLVD